MALSAAAQLKSSMTYQALARQWRPRTFSELVGQEHVTKPLIQSLNQQRVHHAYLFTGTRGVGKTSVGRLLAKALNCEKAINATPCLQCDACRMIEQNRFIDLIEVDGASKTRVEDTRELLENVQYAPALGRYKIYLIDEVHMLSTHSANALLKTLEEPPEHVKFILATTDPQKLPITILSRCLQFNLRHLPDDLIAQQLISILEKEDIHFEPSSLEVLAYAAKGSMRDALSLLEQALANADEKDGIRTQDIKQMLGYTQRDYALDMIEALVKSDASLLIQLSREVAVEGGHFEYVLGSILTYLHHIAISQHLPPKSPFIYDKPEIKTIAKQILPEEAQLFYQIGLKASEDMHLAPNLALGFEMTLLRMLTFKTLPADISFLEKAPDPLAKKASLSSPQENKSKVETPLISASNPSASSGFSPSVNTSVPQGVSDELKPESKLQPSSLSSPLKNQQAIDLKPTETERPALSWDTLIQALKLNGLAHHAARNAALIGIEGSEYVLQVTRGHEPLFTEAVKGQIELALSEFYQKKLKIKLSITNEPSVISPAKEAEEMNLKRQKQASEALEKDDFFLQLKQGITAEVLEDSVFLTKNDL